MYETSLHLSIIFNSPTQTTSVISHLLPSIYNALPELHSNLMSTVLLASLHFLCFGYPSQSRCFEHLHSLPDSFLPKYHPVERWLRDLMRTLRLHNYSRLEDLTSREVCERVLKQAGYASPRATIKTRSSTVDLILEALCTLVNALRLKARETSWLVLRTAYRELSLPKPSDTDPAPTRAWLCQSLALKSVKGDAGSSITDVVTLLDTWVESRQAQGDIKPKEGVEGRWIVVKPKIG